MDTNLPVDARWCTGQLSTGVPLHQWQQHKCALIRSTMAGKCGLRSPIRYVATCGCSHAERHALTRDRTNFQLNSTSWPNQTGISHWQHIVIEEELVREALHLYRQCRVHTLNGDDFFWKLQRTKNGRTLALELLEKMRPSCTVFAASQEMVASDRLIDGWQRSVFMSRAISRWNCVRPPPPLLSSNFFFAFLFRLFFCWGACALHHLNWARIPERATQHK